MQLKLRVKSLEEDLFKASNANRSAIGDSSMADRRVSRYLSVCS